MKAAAPLFPVGKRGEKPLSVGMKGVSKNLPSTPFFHDEPRIHDIHTIRNPAYDAQIVGDIQDGHGSPFLNEFMQASDMVKFAKLPPDENILIQAVSKAETLVNETRPAEDEGGSE